jgi:peptidoglycan hydrolase-like protein with peptidoglycan-binding domain
MLDAMFFAVLKNIFLFSLVFSTVLQADETIRAAQSKLASLGFYHANVDGSLGSMTSAAIRRFQIAQKLKVTGSLNQQTLEALQVKAPPPLQDYKKISALFEGGALAGDNAATQVAAIRSIQRALAGSGFYAGPHNGLPSLALTNAIREWQLANGLTQTGKLDARTLAGLGVATN